MPRLLAFSGSSRSGSFNQRLVRIAADLARAQGAEVNEIDLRALELPLFDQDLEADPGPPAAAARLRHAMMEHDGFLIACPEYNGSITPLLKNAIDWASRPEAGVAPLAAFAGKTATLLATSPGALGGIRGLAHVRDIFSGLGTHVLPIQVAVPFAAEAFAPDGKALAQERTQGLLSKAIEQAVHAAHALKR
ncbi:MAG: NAD(P)H-dependent oxidoreductase [Planctomycetota bacterium]